MLFEILSEIGNGTRQRRGAILSGSISIEVRWKIRGIRAFRLIGAAIIYRSHYRSENGSRSSFCQMQSCHRNHNLTTAEGPEFDVELLVGWATRLRACNSCPYFLEIA